MVSTTRMNVGLGICESVSVLAIAVVVNSKCFLLLALNLECQLHWCLLQEVDRPKRRKKPTQPGLQLIWDGYQLFRGYDAVELLGCFELAVTRGYK